MELEKQNITVNTNSLTSQETGLNLPDPSLLGNAREIIGKRICVLIADEHPIVRQGLTALLGQQAEMEVVMQAQSGEEAIQCFDKLLPDVGLFDFQLAGMGGIQVMLAILQKQPKAKIIVFTASQNEEQIYRSIEAGARGYLLKTSSEEEIISCIHAVYHGQTWIPDAIKETLARRLAAPELTKREQEVLHVMSAGKSNKQIGAVLNMSEGTVKVHVTHILEKLKVDGRAEALGVAFARGLVTLENTTVIKDSFSHRMSRFDGEKKKMTA